MSRRCCPHNSSITYYSDNPSHINKFILSASLSLILYTFNLTLLLHKATSIIFFPKFRYLQYLIFETSKNFTIWFSCFFGFATNLQYSKEYYLEWYRNFQIGIFYIFLNFIMTQVPQHKSQYVRDEGLRKIK